MNKGDAVAVQALLDWVLALTLWEVDTPADHLTDDELIRIIGVLADRSSTALGAGLRQGDAITAAMRMLGLEPARILNTSHRPVERLDLPDDDVPANAGSTL